MSIDISLKDVRVLIGMPTNRPKSTHTTKALLETQKHLIHAGIPYANGFVSGCAVIEKARDEVVQIFMESDFTHLFWIDDDMVWTPEDFIRILALSIPMGIVCAAYPAKNDDDTITFFVKTATEEWTQHETGLYEIEGIGLGFFCMRREIAEELVATKPIIWDDVLGGPRPSVFRVDLTDHGYKGTAGKFRSEDMAFCADLRELGHKIYLDPEVSLGHVGEKVYRGSIKDAIQVAY